LSAAPTHARRGTIIFGDLVGKLDVLRVECAKCGRSGRYRLARLIARHGRSEKPFTWLDVRFGYGLSMSVSERLTDSNQTSREVREVPFSDSCTAANIILLDHLVSEQLH
jgi:hypothetical protein